MTMTFEQLPFVYQVETLVHVPWFGDAGVQNSYTYQTLESDLKQEALRIWQEEKYELNNILRNLTADNNRKDGAIHLMERLLNYKRTGQFGGDLDTYYRCDNKKVMNDIYQKQLDKTSHQIQNLNKLSALIFPHQLYNFDRLQQEITRLKYQELAPQVREEKSKYEQLITAAKEKIGEGSFVPIIDLFLEAHQQREKTVETSQKDKLSGKIEAYQGILENNNLGKEELQTLLDKQKEFYKLEEHLASLQIDEQKVQVPPK